MELGDVLVGGLAGPVDRHEVLEVVVEDQRVRHRQPVWLHRVAWTVVVIPNLGLVKITHFSLGVPHDYL